MQSAKFFLGINTHLRTTMALEGLLGLSYQCDANLS